MAYNTEVHAYGVDTGSVNAMAITLGPATLTQSQLVGIPIRVKIADTNTSSAVTLVVNSLGAQSVLNPDGQTPAIGQFKAGAMGEFIWDGSHYQGVSITGPTVQVLAQTLASNFTASSTYSGSLSITLVTPSSGYIFANGGINVQTASTGLINSALSLNGAELQGGTIALSQWQQGVGVVGYGSQTVTFQTICSSTYPNTTACEMQVGAFFVPLP